MKWTVQAEPDDPISLKYRVVLSTWNESSGRNPQSRAPWQCHIIQLSIPNQITSEDQHHRSWGREFLWSSDISDIGSPGPGWVRRVPHRPERRCNGDNRRHDVRCQNKPTGVGFCKNGYYSADGEFTEFSRSGLRLLLQPIYFQGFFSAWCRPDLL